MPDLNYKITTTAELAGAQAAEASLDREISKAKALGKEFSEQAKQRDTIRASIAAYNADIAKQSAMEAEIAKSVAAGGAARKKIQDEIASGVHTVTQEEIAAATVTADVDAEAVNSKTLIRQALRALGLEFPMLARIAKLGLSEIGAAFVSVSAAIAIWRAKLQEAREEAAQMEIPDFKIEDVSKASEAWNGLAEARKAANDAFTSGSEIYARAIKDLREILALENQQLEAEKKKALADLDSKKDTMSPEAYRAARGRIEDIYGATEMKGTQAERQQEIARKYEEAANLEIRARNAHAAQARLPQADAAHEKAAQEALQAGLGEFKTKIEDQRKALEFVQQYNALNADGGIRNLATKEGISAAYKFDLKYGGMANGDEMEKQERAKLAALQEQERNIREVADKREAAIKERDAQREIETSAAKAAQTIRDELPFDERSNARQTAAENKRTATAGGVQPDSAGFAPADILKVENTTGGKAGEALGQLAAETGSTNTQIVNMVTRILNHQLTMQQAFAALEAKQAQIEQQASRAQATADR